MGQKIAITGMGIISAIGNNVEENLSSLKTGKHGISDIQLFETRHTGNIKTGEIKLSNEELVQKLQLHEDNNATRTSLLGMVAAKEAVESAGISNINEYKTGLISSTSVGGMDITEKYFYTYEDFPEKQKYIDAHDAGNSSLLIADYLGLQGMVSTISTACSSAANAIMMGAKLIKNGVLDRVIVGGTDSLSKFTLNGFSTLMILTDSYNTPFDNDRKGLNLGEAAAFIVLESDEVVKKENKKVLGYLSGYGNANDAHHQTASSENGQGAFLAMEKALNISGLEKENIDYINVHGTATPNNDLSEGIAMIRIFGENNVPEFSSTKAFTGHTLAAAAGIEAVYSLLAIQNNIIFPNLNFKTKMDEFDLTPVTELKEKNINHVLSNSFGFGGKLFNFNFLKIMSPVYINSAACISVQDTLNENFFQNLQPVNLSQVVKAIEPNYKEFIPPAASRRMSKTVKMSSVASKYALQEAGIENPDAIIVGTGMGCSQDSEKFLKNVIDNNEEFLTPTYFIQSTHNTVAGQIALGLQCHAYNFTYVNTSSSLEFSFLDAKLQINDGEADNVLVGSTDEQTDRTMELYRLNNTIKKEEDLPVDYLKSTTNGVIWGEGASFFVLGKDKTENSYAQLKDIQISSRLDLNETQQFIEGFLAKNQLTSNDINAVILGFSGDAKSDVYYTKAMDVFQHSALLYYKHLSGEFNTASGFSTFMACHILKNQEIPEVMMINDLKKEGIKKILLYNHLGGNDHSLVLLERA